MFRVSSMNTSSYDFIKAILLKNRSNGTVVNIPLCTFNTYTMTNDYLFRNKQSVCYMHPAECHTGRAVGAFTFNVNLVNFNCSFKSLKSAQFQNFRNRRRHSIQDFMISRKLDLMTSELYSLEQSQSKCSILSFDVIFSMNLSVFEECNDSHSCLLYANLYMCNSTGEAL